MQKQRPMKSGMRFRCLCIELSPRHDLRSQEDRRCKQTNTYHLRATFDLAFVVLGGGHYGFAAFIRHSPDGLRRFANKMSDIGRKVAKTFLKLVYPLLVFLLLTFRLLVFYFLPVLGLGVLGGRFPEDPAYLVVRHRILATLPFSKRQPAPKIPSKRSTQDLQKQELLLC